MQTEGYEGSQLLRPGVGGTKRVAVGSMAEPVGMHVLYAGPLRQALQDLADPIRQ